MRWVQSQFPTFKRLFGVWRDGLTSTGKTMAGVAVLCLPTLATLDSPLFVLFSTLLSLLVFTGITGYWFRPRLDVQIITPSEGVQGEAIDLVVRLHFLLARMAPVLTVQLVDLPTSWTGTLVQGSVTQYRNARTARVPMKVIATRRGLFTLPKVRVTHTFPFGLFRFHKLYSPLGTFVVVPTYRPLANFDLSQGDSRYAGEREIPDALLGDCGDYFGSREYVPGMPVRRWDHRASARLGYPVVREFTDPHHLTAAIVADTTPSPAPDSLEATISLSAALSEALTEENYRIVSLATGDGVQDLSQLGTSGQHDAILRALAIVDSGSKSVFKSSIEASTLAPSIVFMLINRFDSDCAESCERAALHGGSVRRIFIDRNSSEAIRPMAGDVIVGREEIEAGNVKIG